MSYLVTLTEQAAFDIENAATWWATHRSSQQAERWYAGIRAAIAGLTLNPRSHGLAAEHADFGYELRELLFGLRRRPTHRVIFTVAHQTVVVLAVRHAAQDRLQPGDF